MLAKVLAKALSIGERLDAWAENAEEKEKEKEKRRRFVELSAQIRQARTAPESGRLTLRPITNAVLHVGVSGQMRFSFFGTSLR